MPSISAMASIRSMAAVWLSAARRAALLAVHLLDFDVAIIDGVGQMGGGALGLATGHRAVVQYDNVSAFTGELVSRGQAGDAGSDDADVRFSSVDRDWCRETSAVSIQSDVVASLTGFAITHSPHPNRKPWYQPTRSTHDGVLQSVYPMRRVPGSSPCCPRHRPVCRCTVGLARARCSCIRSTGPDAWQ